MQPLALTTIEGLMGRDEFPTVQLQAAKSVIDWTEGRAMERVEHRGTITLAALLGVVPIVPPSDDDPDKEK